MIEDIYGDLDNFDVGQSINEVNKTAINKNITSWLITISKFYSWRKKIKH